MTASRRNFVTGLVASGAMPLFNIGCIGFGQSRSARLADGAPVRIAIIGCGSWGQTLLNRAGVSDQCELVAISDPDPKAISDLYAKCGKVWS